MTDHPAKPRTSSALAVLAVLLLLSACSSSSGTTTTDERATQTSSAPAEPVQGGKVVWGLEAETDGLNPISGRFAMSGHMMASAIFDPLATLDADGRPVPFLAESIEPNADFTVWTITVRDGINFSDGTPLTADAVADVLNRQMGSAMTGKSMVNIASIEVTGPRQVTVTTKLPWATFPGLLTSQIGYVPAPSMLDAPEDARAPVGTGPFIFQSWNYGVSFKARKNPNYWRRDSAGRPLPYLDAIEFRPIPDAQQRGDELVSGNLDAIDTNDLVSISSLQGTPGINVTTYDNGEKRFVMLNAGKAPFDNPKARLAAAYATDVSRFMQATAGGKAVPASSPWSPGQPGYREDADFPGFDIDRAKQYVSEYEAETGQPLTVEVTASVISGAPELLQILKQDWEAAGMKVTLKTVDQADLVVLAALGQYQAVDFRLFGFTEPTQEYVWLSSDSIDKSLISLNFAQYADPRIDAAFQQARGTLDPTVQDAALASVATYLNESPPYLWLNRVIWAIAANDTVHGYDEALNGSMQTLGAKTWVASLWKG